VRASRFDGPFWILLLAGVLLAGALGCFGLAAAAQDVGTNATGIIAPGDS
jgi:hypothetical protein